MTKNEHVSNYVGVSIGSIIGSTNSTVNNFLLSENSMFSNTESGIKNLNLGHYNLILLELLEYFGESLSDEVEKAMQHNLYPFKIKITDLVNVCSQIIYYNNGNNEHEVRKLINALFTLVCSPLGLEYQAKIVRVANNYFFELYQRTA